MWLRENGSIGRNGVDGRGGALAQSVRVHRTRVKSGYQCGSAGDGTYRAHCGQAVRFGGNDMAAMQPLSDARTRSCPISGIKTLQICDNCLVSGLKVAMGL
jgi:hypothetical protein